MNDAHAGASPHGTTAFARLKAFVVELHQEAKRDNVFNGAAALGFYLTLAIFPSMIVLMAAIPYLPIGHVDEAILDLLAQVLPGGTATMFSSVVAEITGEKRAGLLSLGLAGTLWAASSGMYAVMQQMNVAYDVEEGRPFLRARATALGLTLLFAVLVLGAFSLVVLGGVIQDWLIRRYGFGDGLLAFFVAFRWAVIVAALVVALSFIYYAAPNRRQRLARLWPGTLVATALLVAASLAFKLYVTTFADYDRTYGSIGAVIVLMLWLYMVGLVMLAGAEINALLARRRAQAPPRPPADADGLAPADAGANDAQGASR